MHLEISRSPAGIRILLRSMNRFLRNRKGSSVAICPGATSTRGGGAFRQTAMTRGHRFWNRQPGGSSYRVGTRPSITGSRCLSRCFQARNRPKQPPACTGGPDLAKRSATGRGLGHLTGIHDQHRITGFGDDPQIVGDEDYRHARFLLKLADDLQNLGLNGHVQGRGRLVGDEDVRLAGQRHGDHDPLAHAARYLVGVFAETLFRIRNAHPAQGVRWPLCMHLARRTCLGNGEDETPR